MKTAFQIDLARDLPSLLFTAAISAGCVIASAVLHAQLTGGGSQPAAQPVSNSTLMSVAPISVAQMAEPKVQIKAPQVNQPRVSSATSESTAAETQPPQLNAPSVAVNPVTPVAPAKPVDGSSLAELRAMYEREREEFRQAVGNYLALSETAARESADPEALKRATAARDAFSQGIIPNDAPEAALSELLSARQKVVAELQAAGLDKELLDFQAQESADIGNVIQRFPKCTFRLINLETGLALAAKSTGRGSAVIQAKEDATNPMQHWYVAYHGKLPHLKNRATKTVLNVPGGNRAGGVKIILWDDKSSELNVWEMQYRGSYYHIHSKFSGKLLSVPAAKRDEGLSLIQWPHHDAPDDQKWKLVRVLTDAEES